MTTLTTIIMTMQMMMTTNPTHRGCGERGGAGRELRPHLSGPRELL